jgi:hypothetical protein
LNGDVELTHRHLTENEARYLEMLLRASAKLMFRCRQIQASIESINSEDHKCPRCDEVEALLNRIDPDWRALKSAFQGVFEDSQVINLSARLLELVEDKE